MKIVPIFINSRFPGYLFAYSEISKNSLCPLTFEDEPSLNIWTLSPYLKENTTHEHSLNWLILFKKIIAVYYENHVKPISTPCGKKVELLIIIKAGGIYSYHYVLKGWIFCNSARASCTERLTQKRGERNHINVFRNCVVLLHLLLLLLKDVVKKSDWKVVIQAKWTRNYFQSWNWKVCHRNIPCSHGNEINMSVFLDVALCSLLSEDDGGSQLLRNVGQYLSYYIAQHPTSQTSCSQQLTFYFIIS
jgi:hypothetical protein